MTILRKYTIKVIGGKKVWCKFCPNCGKEQIYSTLRAVAIATKKNRRCLSCKNSGKNNPFFGKTHTPTHKNWLSTTQLNRCSFRYKKNGTNPQKTKKNCKNCGQFFYVVRSQLSRSYCCYDCSVKDNFGFLIDKKTYPEIKFESWLLDKGIEYKSPFYLSGKLYDFYVPSRNLLVEIDGVYWHGKNLSDKQLNKTQKSNRANDNIKNRLAQEKGYNLVRIWEDELDHVSEYIHQ